MPKIALEEHFMAPDLVEYWRSTFVNIDGAVANRAQEALADFGDRRLATMDRCGIGYAVLSLAGPGVQIEPDAALARRRACAVNDHLAGEISRRPQRFGGFAHLPMQDPAAAADELERCVTQLGFHGAMINGTSNGAYLDGDRFLPFWERAEALGAPIYLHPGNAPDHPAMYEGHGELWGPLWSWGVDTATHALRLVFAGLFERFARLTLILGHMGEGLPFQLWRLDSRWQVCNRGGRSLPQPPSAYIRRNIAVTTSGVCATEPLLCALGALGEDRVMFSADYPFEDAGHAAAWIDGAPVGEAVRARICHGNAAHILRLPG